MQKQGWRVGLWLLVAGLLVAASGCGDDDPAAAGCAVDADCRGARQCVEGVCVDASENNGDNNTPTNNAPTNNPVNNNPAECGSDMSCPVGTVCDGGSCDARTCGGDADCGSGDRFCYGGLCYPEIACSADGECASLQGTCEAGRCVPGCVIDGDCPNPGVQQCVSGRCVESCTADRDCGLEDICEGGVCVPSECRGTGTAGCPEGERCREQRCVEYTACATDGECSATEQCEAGICEPRRSCIGDANCNAGQQCLNGLCYDAQACETREACGEGLDCVGGYCVPFVCRGASDCGGGEICNAGVCEEAPASSEATRVVILTPSQVLFPGQVVELQAVALDGDGAILPGQSFAWLSSDEDVASVDEDGVATGGQTSGSASVTATLIGNPDVAPSAPITLRNPGAAQPGMDRVVVVDRRTGAPVEGAMVVRGESSATTSATGVATFEPSASAATVSVYKEGYNYLTLVDVSGADLLAPLGEAQGGGSIGGFKGEIDTSRVSTQGDITIGLAGASLDGELGNLDLQTLLGDSFNTQISIPGLFNGAFPLPGGLVLYGTVFGFSLNIKDMYYARSEGGLKVGWSFGGFINAQDAIGLVGGGGDAASILPTVLAFFEAFDHGIRPVEVEERPLVADGDDIDGDGDRAELIPDYDSFPDYTMTPSVRQGLRASVQVGELPVGGDQAFAIVVGGVINQGIGFVPLGINVSQDEDGDGVPDPAPLKMAPPHSGLSDGEYAVVAITFDPSQVGAGLEGIDLPDDIAVTLWRGASIPTDFAFDADFLPLPGGSWSGPSRTLSGATSGDAGLYRATFVSRDASWEVYFGGEAEGFQLPSPPQGFSDWAAGSEVRLQAYHTAAGVTLDTVAGPQGVGVHRLSKVSGAFSRATLGN